jgi:hypothetical protein
MNGALILLVVLAAVYLALNVRRLVRGRPWAFSVCQVAKEWEKREHARRLAARAADRAQPAAPNQIPAADADDRAYRRMSGRRIRRTVGPRS